MTRLLAPQEAFEFIKRLRRRRRDDIIILLRFYSFPPIKPTLPHIRLSFFVLQ